MPSDGFVGGKEAARVLGVSQKTLRIWADSGRLRSFRLPSGYRRYDPASITNVEGGDVHHAKQRIVYCRVSTAGQRQFLNNQVEAMRAKHPGYRIITDIGSGLNFKRKGLRTILDLCFAGRLKELRLSHKDRLCRFAFDLLRWVFARHGVEVHVDDGADASPRDEFCEDLLSVITVFAARTNGARSYQGRRGAAAAAAEATQDGDGGADGGETSSSGDTEGSDPGGDADSQDSDEADSDAEGGA